MYGLNFVSFNFDKFSHLTLTHLPIFFKGRNEYDYSFFFFYLNKLKIFKHPGKFANQYIPTYWSNQYIPIDRIFFSNYLLILYRLSWSLIFDFKFELSWYQMIWMPRLARKQTFSFLNRIIKKMGNEFLKWKNLARTITEVDFNK